MNNLKMFRIFFLFFIFTTFASSTLNKIHKCSKEQSEALLLFKQNLSYTYTGSYLNYRCDVWLGSDYHAKMMNWNTNTDCCNWKGVTCDRSTGDVIGIDVNCGMLKGTIHPNSSLFNLPHLQKLNLAFNDFHGSQIPSEIGRFSNSLTHLNLSHCGLSGQVPPDITLLHKLVSLDISNYLKLGPHVFINMFQNFTNLEELSLEEVNISSVLPAAIDISSSLKLLNLPNTRLKGKLPHYIFNLHSLKTLDLSLNDFTGDIPLEIKVNLTHLTYLDLSSNKLSGTLPSWLFTSPSLEYLFLYNNMFSGNVPFESFALPSLKILDLTRNNQLSGHTDVQTFRQLTNLTVLRLPYNNFSGEWELDTLLSSLRNLEDLDLSYSGFSVTTKNVDHYVNPGFRYLNLASCKLKVFPSSFRAMKELEGLDLSGNEIHGQIPHWAGEIGGNELYELDLSHNFITGLPQFQWYGLSELYLQSNLIEGPFPPSIWNMSTLWILDMSNNRMSIFGVFPENISSSLSVLNVKSNMIEGSFPPSICNLSNLHSLDMSNNSFGGVIPECVGSLSTLSMIDLGTNNFHGTIPNVYGEYLEGVILNGNQLEGEVPHSLSKCEYLKVLDLGNNNLSGTFPIWLGGLSQLEVLVLKTNNFHGPIETSITKKLAFSSLQVLDLSYNRFGGKLPGKYFQNFEAMKNMVSNRTKPIYLSMGVNYYSIIAVVKDVQLTFTKLLIDYTIVDLSNNRFEGEIPNVMGSLKSLKVLNLSHNNLNGEIPNALGNISGIESLDLSWNQLIGEIPQSLAEIKGLAVLNLSENHLVGRIPKGTQFNTFEESSFEGNPGLCGLPLTKKCFEHTHKPQLESHEEESGFTWKVVTLGYGCGTLLGLVMGYLMLSTRKVKWFNAIADAGESLVLKKIKKKKRRHIYIGK
ncbi:leucine-rich repeat-containing protein [Tanacetum coccineum]